MSRRTRDVVSALAVAVIFALPLLPEILGARRLIFRDALVTHWPWRRVAVASLSGGEVPFVNAEASGGQPLLANPNAVLLYPTFLFERVFPPASAFNLHYLIHVFWAFLGARVLARRLGLPEGAAFLSGVAFAFSGMLLSYGSAFMNSGAAAAWLPWCAASAVDLVRTSGTAPRLRAAAATGLALGLQLLAGEPAISALTVVFIAGWTLVEAWNGPRDRRARRFGGLFAGGILAGTLALGLAAPLLLPLRAVFPMTVRGQHLYSKSAFGAAPFRPWMFLEWLLPRIRGNPSVAGVESWWLHSGDSEIVVYIWCVTLGVAPLLMVAVAALDRRFWDGRVAALAGAAGVTLLFSFGFSLPLYGLLYGVPFLRRMRYPIKFYLLTTLCVALLSGLAAAALSRQPIGRRGIAVLAAVLCLLAAAWIAAAPGGPIDQRAHAVLSGSPYDAAVVEALRGLVRGDAAVGAATVVLVGLLLKWGPQGVDRGYLLGLATLCLAMVWGLPLFASGASSELDRPPALLDQLRGEGRLYVPSAERLVLSALEPMARETLPRQSAAARARIERMVPLTGAAFGVRSLFDQDPDGSYGYYNRIAGEAAAASAPEAQDRLLRAFGARWVLAHEGDPHPLYRPATGISVAHERLVLYEDPNVVPDVRWAGRAHRRASLSGTLDLLRSDAFDPSTDVALPGPKDLSPENPPTTARVRTDVLAPDRVRATVDAQGPGHLVFSRTYFPVWKARVDGRPARVLVANARDLGVELTAGPHTVEIAYDRRPFRIGVAIQAAALLAAIGIAVATRR
jgi:hypothetical protein